jgi:hypothetical protein
MRLAAELLQGGAQRLHQPLAARRRALAHAEQRNDHVLAEQLEVDVVDAT